MRKILHRLRPALRLRQQRLVNPALQLPRARKLRRHKLPASRECNRPSPVCSPFNPFNLVNPVFNRKLRPARLVHPALLPRPERRLAQR
jgi:hypothetical protein